jgi:hypothetical protein
MGVPEAGEGRAHTLFAISPMGAIGALAKLFQIAAISLRMAALEKRVMGFSPFLSDAISCYMPPSETLCTYPQKLWISGASRVGNAALRPSAA